MSEPFEWRPWEPLQLSARKWLRCEPAASVVLDVVVEPASERGHWRAHWLGRGGTRWGTAPSVEEAQQQALDAAEAMFCEALEALERRRVG